MPILDKIKEDPVKAIAALALVILVIVILFDKMGSENYVSKLDSLDPAKDHYYRWRALGSILDGYPYNRQPRPHSARFNYYLPEFITKGYGQW